MIIETGSIINKTYRIEKYIGKGSMGNIYLLERIKDGKKLFAEDIICPLKEGEEEGDRYHILFKEIFSAEGSDDMSFLRKYGFFKDTNSKFSSKRKRDLKSAGDSGSGGSIILPLVVISLLIVTICGLLLGLSVPGVAGFFYY